MRVPRALMLMCAIVDRWDLHFIGKTVHRDNLRLAFARVLNYINKMYYVYILSNRWKTVYNTGMTNDIRCRVFKHKTGKYPRAFTKLYNCHHLMYYEERRTLHDAFQREQVVKRLRHGYKQQLIQRMNPSFIDLAANWYDDPA
jgi:putative endonuclease